MMRTSRLAAGVVAGALALALSACAGASQNGAENGTKGGSDVLTVEGDAGDPTLIENFNPYASTQLGGTRLLYEPLEIPSSVDGTYPPFLATGYTVVNPTTITYTIRQGVRWSDGKPFSAADVVFSFDLLKKFPALDLTGVWAQLKSVSASGDTVTMTLQRANVPFAATLAQVPIVPEHIWSSVKDPTKFANTDPVGTGPFTLGAYAPTEYVLKKNPSYWQADKIAPAEVDYPVQSSNQSTNQLDVISGKYDWSYNYIPDVQKTYLPKSKYNQYWFPPGGIIALFLNLTKAPYNDANFRLGISYALDRSTIAQKAVDGYTTAASLSGLILPNAKQWLDPSLPDQGMVSRNTALSSAAFAKAGYTMSGGRLSKDGKQASITITMPNNYSDWIAAATEVKSELGRVGIKVSLDEPQSAQYTKEIGAGTFDAAMGGFGGTGTPYTDFDNALNSHYAAPINTATVNNFERFKSSTVDASLDALAAATTKSEQLKSTYQLEQFMYHQVPIIPLYYGGSWGLFSTKSFTGWPSARDPYTLPTPYNDMVLLVLTHLRKA